MRDLHAEHPELCELAADYAAAVDRAVKLREQWRDEGEPMVAVGSRGQPRPHPLVAMVERAEAHVAECARVLALPPMEARKVNARRGRPPGPSLAEMGASVSTEPPALRRIG